MFTYSKIQFVWRFIAKLRDIINIGKSMILDFPILRVNNELYCPHPTYINKAETSYLRLKYNNI